MSDQFGLATPQTFGAMETAVANSLATQERAKVEARYHVALARPRNIMQVRAKILEACNRTAFAETAQYAKPVGNQRIVGPSIRFAEESVRAMGNILIETAVIHDDADRRITRVTVTDLESNVTIPHDIMLAKTVERKSLRQGQQAKGQRMNSYGELVYLVEATEDDLLNKQAAQASKAIRTAALRLLPGDILEEAMNTVRATLKAQDRKDPTLARKKLADAFQSVGIQPDALAQYLGHDFEAITPDELDDLRSVYTAIKEREATWKEVMELKYPPKAADGGAQDGGKAASRNEELAKRLGRGKKLAEPPKAQDPGQVAGEPQPAPPPPAGEAQQPGLMGD